MVMTEKKDIKSYNLDELKQELANMGEKPFRAGQIYKWLHIEKVQSFDEMTNISKNLRETLDEQFEIVTLEPVRVLISKIDGTRKYLFRIKGGAVIESVLMRYHHGNSVCISTQSGCRMGCRFCASTLNGLDRNLRPSELLEQIYEIEKNIGEKVSNIVLMGSGEPLDNFENVTKFLELISDENGLNISQRNITLSTCGLVPRMKELANMHPQITLALSLHASDDDTRRELLPIARKYTIAEVLDACKYYFDKTGRRITFEYSLVAGVNDTVEEAEKLSALVRNLNCHVNLIPVNPIKESDFVQTGKKAVERFKRVLEKNRINVTIRREMGRDINGACGQLRNDAMREERRNQVNNYKINAFGKTDVGLMRTINQDSIFVSTKPVGKLPNLFIVADGMGGHKAGDVASRVAIEKFVKYACTTHMTDPANILDAGIMSINKEIYDMANSNRIIAEWEQLLLPLLLQKVMFILPMLETADYIILEKIYNK